MNPLLQTHFDTALEHPNGIKKLRELILTLAMQGKLVSQDPNDQPACELLKEIQAEKARLVADPPNGGRAGKIKKSEALPQVKDEEKPFVIPMGWEWVRVRDVRHDWGQKVPNTKFTYIDVGSILNTEGKLGDDLQVLTPNVAPSRARKIVKKGTVIYSTVRPYLLNIAIIDRDFEYEAIASTAFAILHPHSTMVAKFIFHYLRSPSFIGFVESLMKGVAYPAINDGDFYSALFPLPPLAEQKRIVEKIDQLFALCDELERLKQTKDAKRKDLHQSVITQMLEAETHSDFQRHFQFLTTQFNELYSVKENVKELRKAVLQLAVMGKLVPQDEKDQPASELLKEIQAEKARLVVEGKIKKSEALPAVKEEEKPFAIPNGWEWVRLGEVISNMDSGWSPQCEDVPVSLSEWGVLKTTSVQEYKFLSHENKALPKKLEPRESAEVKEGDILITRAGPTNRVGICCVVDSIRPRLMLSDKIIRFQLVSKAQSKLFLLFSMSNGFGNKQLEKFKSGMALSQVNISQDKLKSLILPLPPLAEQKRIVEKVDQLMALCDTLEEGIGKAEEKRGEILEGMVRV